MVSGRLLRVLRRIIGWIVRPASLPALIALVAVGLLGLLADYQNHQIFEQHARATVADRPSKSLFYGLCCICKQLGNVIFALCDASRGDMDTYLAL